MAFNVWFRSDPRFDVCDKCKKPAAPKRPLLVIQYRERTRDSSNLIDVHEDCLRRSIEKARTEINKE